MKCRQPCASFLRAGCFVCVPLGQPALSRAPRNANPSHRVQPPSFEDFVTIYTMKIIIYLCVLTVVVISSAQQQVYNRYDNFNTDSIIQNDRILLAYYKCVMDKGPCTKDGKNFKRVLPETLSTACARCTTKQKAVVRKMLLGIREKSEPRFLELLDKYDPEQYNREALYTFLLTGQ
uniref:Chemosensory protein CSP20 n=1 Tax=Carposina sasakii TaxID=252295 RepID=A0A9E8LCT5_CARSA|nr:chemosensory protein CSP20 [Carposina sasakii]